MIHIIAGAALGGLVWLLGNRSVVAGGLMAILVAIFSYLALPVYAWNFSDPWIMLVLGLGSGALLSVVMASATNNERGVTGGVVLGLIAGCVAVLGIVTSILTSWSFFHAPAYVALLGNIEELPFERAVERLDTTGRQAGDHTLIDQSEVRIIDQVLAIRRAQELLGHEPQWGGTFLLDKMSLTRRQGRLTWAAPLAFNGVFKWRGSDGVPAYVWVDAHDSRVAGVTKEVNGRPIRMQCVGSAYLGYDIERLVWSSGLQTTGLADFSFEIGPDNRPFYVATTYDNKVGFYGSDPTGVAVVDPQTCAVTRHGMNDIPAWVNRVVPDDMAVQQVRDWGELRHGWNNVAPWGAHTDTREPTPGIELVSTSRGGDTAWYLGITNAGNRQGTNGFMLVDSRTKRVAYFELNGATEDGARAAILGKIAEKRGWDSTWPILYNIGNRATYLSTLKDASGNYKGIALLPVDDRGLVIIADDLPRALQTYTAALASRGNGVPGANPADTIVQVDGAVARLASEVVDGNTVYWLTFGERPDTVFRASNALGPQVALTSVGDRVQVRAQGEGGVLTVQRFVNTKILPVTEPADHAAR